MNKRQRSYWYPLIVKSQGGEFCAGCGISKSQTNENLLLIDHRNNIKNNNVLINLQLLCRSCNRIKNPDRHEHYERSMTPEMIRQTKGEPKFRNWLFRKVSENHFIKREIAIDSGAEFSQMSIEAIKGYVRKCVSEEGLYTISYDSDGQEIIVFKGDERSVEEEITESKQYRTIP